MSAGLILLTIAGCTEWERFNPTGSLYHYAPRATGMWLTDEQGQIVGVWGHPEAGTWIDTVFSPTGDTSVSILAYPNPTRPPLDIAFYVRHSDRVTLWVVRALGPGEEGSELTNVGGAGVISDDGRPVAILVDEPRSAGRYVINWGGSGTEAGFYRIWLAVGEDITWTDIYISD